MEVVEEQEPTAVETHHHLNLEVLAAEADTIILQVAQEILLQLHPVKVIVVDPEEHQQLMLVVAEVEPDRLEETHQVQLEEMVDPDQILQFLDRPSHMLAAEAEVEEVVPVLVVVALAV
jgi:hypothetical protein